MGSTVLVPVKNHAPWARAVAEAVTDVEDDGTDAVVLHVFDDAEEETTRRNLGDARELSLDELASRKTGVSAALGVLEDDGLDTTPRGVRAEDTTANAIVAARRRTDADRVYMFGRRRSPTGKAVFGSTVQDIVLNARVPVTVVPALEGT